MCAQRVERADQRTAECASFAPDDYVLDISSGTEMKFAALLANGEIEVSSESGTFRFDTLERALALARLTYFR